MTTVIKLAPVQARKAVVMAQGIHKEHELGKGRNATLKAIEKLGYIQIDTISVVERAHHHTLWNRARGYSARHLDNLLDHKQVFEYWSHAAAYLPMRDFRYSLPYKEAVSNGAVHWYQCDPKLLNDVLQRVRQEGPLQARDFEHVRKGEAGWWEWKPAKRALEQLFIEGKLMIARRQGFQKIYDLPERVLPSWVDTRTPDTEEFYDHLIKQFLSANAIGTPAQIAYLRKGHKAGVQKRCRQLLEDGQLLAVTVGQQEYYASTELQNLLSKPLSRTKVKILSPFDNLLIQRKRTREIFDFDYLIECYVPAEKRKFGYFCLPLLWGQQFAGMLDAKIDRKSGLLEIRALHLQGAKQDDFVDALKPELHAFLEFNNGQSLKLLHATRDRQAVSSADLAELQQKLSAG